MVAELKALLSAQKRSSTTRNDGSFTRVKYVRYADDWCVEINGPKHLAVQIRDEVKSFMTGKLGLTSIWTRPTSDTPRTKKPSSWEPGSRWDLMLRKLFA